MIKIIFDLEAAVVDVHAELQQRVVLDHGPQELLVLPESLSHLNGFKTNININ